MPFKGSAFLAIWNDIVPEFDEEFNEWHTKEHIPERVGIPGFLAGRRYVNTVNGAGHTGHIRYFTLYEGESLEVFHGKDYLARLNSPTPWTQKMMPAFRNFIRGACQTVFSKGSGIGGGLATIALKSSAPVANKELTAAISLAEQLLSMKGITGVHLGAVSQEVTGVQTKEKKLRTNTAEKTFDLLFMAEGLGQEEITSKISLVEAGVKSAFPFAREIQTEIYQLAYMLTSESCSRVPEDSGGKQWGE